MVTMTEPRLRTETDARAYNTATMRGFIIFTLFLIAIAMVSGAPATSTLQSGSPDPENQQFIEEVVVESTLQVRSPSGRQARTNTRTNLQDGARVSETKIH